MRPETRKWLALAAFLAACLAIGAIAGAATATSVHTWYQTLVKPGFTPPDWLFAPVWTLLYIAIAIAGWRAWMRRDHPGTRAAMTAYGAQLALNLAWSFIFFGHHLIGAALAEILVLLAAISVNAVFFWPVDRVAAGLLLPYAAWVAYASALNAALWRLN